MPVDDETAKRNYGWFVFETNGDRTLKSFCENGKKIERARHLTGFLANITLGVKKTAMEALADYGLRDEQEKYFQQMKSRMVCSRQRNGSEDGKTGRLFILFVGLILTSYVRHIWRTTSLGKVFNSSLGILDEMRSIRIIPQENNSESTGLNRLLEEASDEARRILGSIQALAGTTSCKGVQIAGILRDLAT